MGQLFVILMRILFPHDRVARCRELMRVWLDQVIDCVTDPEEIESLTYWSEDRARLEGMIAFLEYFMRVLTYGRARQMLGLHHIHIRLQRSPRVRNPSSMVQLIKRVTQLAHDFHNLDRLAARQAERIQRERDNDPLRLDATHQSTSPSLRLVEANHRRLASTTSQKWGRWVARPCAQDGGGGAFARGPPNIPSSLNSFTPERQLPGSPQLDQNPAHWPAQLMRLILAAALVSLAACSDKPPEPAASGPASATHAAGAPAIIAAERTFAADAAKTGWVEASLQWSAPDALVLGAGLELASQFYANIDPANRNDTSLHWAPEFAGASAAGDFGFTAGPFNGDGAAFGYTLTVWQQQSSGEWRWIFNGGVDTKTPTTIDPAFDVALADAPTGGEGAADVAKTAIDILEAGLATSAATDAPVSLSSQFAANARLQRQDAPPVIGAEAITRALETGPQTISFRQLRSFASAAGDMVFTLGEARWTDDADASGVDQDGSGIYNRIWSSTPDGWRIVFDQIVLRDLPPAAPQ